MVKVTLSERRRLPTRKLFLDSGIANSDDIRPAFRTDTQSQLSQTAIFNSSLVRDTGPDVSATIDQLNNIPISAVSSLAEPAAPWYADQILPFDVTLVGNNEMGAATTMRIFGIEILNFGNGTSIDDTVNESQATFVARFVEPWQAVLLEASRLLPAVR